MFLGSISDVYLDTGNKPEVVQMYFLDTGSTSNVFLNAGSNSNAFLDTGSKPEVSRKHSLHDFHG